MNPAQWFAGVLTFGMLAALGIWFVWDAAVGHRYHVLYRPRSTKRALRRAVEGSRRMNRERLP